jgi:hypothetical protein
MTETQTGYKLNNDEITEIIRIPDSNGEKIKYEGGDNFQVERYLKILLQTPDLPWEKQARNVRTLLQYAPFIEVQFGNDYVPMAFLLLNYTRYSIPKSMQKLFYAAAAVLQQPGLAKDAYALLSYAKAETLEEKYVRRRTVELLKMISDYWGTLPKNVILVTKIYCTELTIGDKTILGTTEPELQWLDHFRNYELQDNVLFRPAFGGYYWYRIVRTSVGYDVYWAPSREGETSKNVISATGTNGVQYQLAVADDQVAWRRYKECKDEKIRYAVQAMDISKLSNQTKTDPIYYQLLMNEYEYQVGHIHDLIVANLVIHVDGYLVVPGDGIGRWAKVWAGDGLFSDPNKSDLTHPRVVKLDLKQTLDRVPSKEHKPTIILMYCQVFMTAEDWKVIMQYHYDGVRVIYIDTKDPPEQLGFRRVNNMVWELGYKWLQLYAFPHDTQLVATGVKYSSLLLTIKNPVFISGGIFKDYFNFMRPFSKKIGDPIEVYNTLEEYITHYTRDSQKYLAFCGAFDPDVYEFVPTNNVFVRTVYRVRKSSKTFLPPEVITYSKDGYVYFCYCEAESAELYFTGKTKTAEYSKLPVLFRGVDGQGFNEWTPEEILTALFPPKSDTFYTPMQLFNLAKRHGYKATFEEWTQAISDVDFIEKLDGKYGRKVKMRVKINTPLIKLEYVPEFMDWARELYPLCPEQILLENSVESGCDRDKFIDLMSQPEPMDDIR